MALLPGVGCRSCGLTAVYGDWKSEFTGYRDPAPAGWPNGVVTAESEMSRYLRHIRMRSEEKEIQAALLPADVLHLDWMYQEYATPCPTEGVKMVNVFLTTAPAAGPTEVLGIANVYEQFEPARFAALSPEEQQGYYLDRLHAALRRCARHFGWSEEPFDRAYRRIIAEDFRFAFYWKRPVTSPGRGAKVQAYVEAGRRTRIYLVFSDRKAREVSRSLLTETATGEGILKHVLGSLSWMDDRTVRIELDNGRDYWTCSTSGEVEFHYPRAEYGDPHGEFDLGRMYYEGMYVIEDRERGLTLIRSAAAQGYKHARSYLDRLERFAHT